MATCKLFFKKMKTWYTYNCSFITQKGTKSAMKKKFFVPIFLGIFVPCLPAQSPHMVICTLKKYPSLRASSSESKFLPTKTVAATEGIYASYFGYLTASNSVGQVVFPRKHHDTAFTLVITDKLEPIFMLENTINTWRVPEKTACAYYSIERKKDLQTNLYFWDVQKKETPPDRTLPLDAITFIAKPEELYIPTGITVTNNNPQLALPTIFVKSSIKLSDNALSIISYRQFFESLNQSIKTEGADVQSKLTRNSG